MREKRIVVGIGASAGGLEAIQEFFDNTPMDTGLSFVVIQHLSPDFKSMMNELLSRNTKMSIYVAQHGMQIEPDSVYLIPPKKNMTMSGGRLQLIEQDRDHLPNLPINLFFSSMARDQADRCVAIVLSGTGSDGSKGLLDVNEAGGLVLAQDLRTAKFNGMPKSAIITKSVHKAMSPSEMPGFILSYIADPDELGAANAHLGEEQSFSGRFPQIFRFVYERHGINLEDYKPGTVNRRIIRRIKTVMDGATEKYVERLGEDPGEVDELAKDLLISVTSFFRDEREFAYLANKVLPKLFQSESEIIRIWVCGCSSGEEAYSIAMLCEEFLAKSKLRKGYKIFATDISQTVISFASQGIFPRETISGIGHSEIAGKYFIEHQDGLQVVQSIRNNIVFTTQNVVTDPPFTRMNLITCRNLLIYFKPNIQRNVLSNFHFGLKPGGFLFLGTSENLGGLQDEFRMVDSRHKIFTKLRDVRIPMQSMQAGFESPPAIGTPLTAFKPESTSRQSLSTFEYDAVLKEIIPNGLVINEKNEMTHLFGEARHIINLSEGRFGGIVDVFQLIVKPLKVPLNTALLQARKSQSKVVFEHVSVEIHGETTLYKLTVKPLSSEKKQSSYTLILLDKEDESEDNTYVASQKLHVDENVEGVIADLQKELQYTKESLQATIEEVETTNEELQSTNEELLASNEELQSTNEELQSVNEELYTVNSEHQEKIRELTDLNHDIDNLLISTDIGTIFIDEKLQIRKFTPQIQKNFNILEHDIGRSIEHFNYSIKDYPYLVEDIKSVYESGRKFEKEVQGHEGNWYLFRVTPYSVGGRVTGTVLSMIEIDSIKRAEERFKLAVEASPSAMIMIDQQHKIHLVNEQAESLFGFSKEELYGKKIEMLLPAEKRARHEEYVAQYLQEPTARSMGMGRDLYGMKKGGETFPVEVGLTPVKISGEIHVISSIIDLTERKKSEAALQQQQIKLVQTARMASIGEMAAGIAHEINNPLTILKGRMKSIHNLLETKELDENKIEMITKKMDNTIDRVSSIIKGLRTFSRDGEQDLIKVVSVDELINDTFDFCKKRLESEGIELRTDILSPDLKIKCRAVQISQVLLNLIQNSRDAVLKLDRPWIELRSWEGLREVFLSVTDSGDGISKEIQKRIFEPFFTTKDVGKGTGLGLSLSKEIVDGHGGRLVLDMDANHTRFVLSLPTNLDSTECG